MHARHVVTAALALACLLIGGCREQHEPIKPTVDLSIVVAAA